jgi:DNA-binding IclR family transcriptional regulator
VFDLLILSYLRRHRELTAKDASDLCQQSPVAARRILDELRNRRLVDRRGEGKGRTYVLGSLAYESLSLKGERPRDLGISETRLEGLLLEELERRKEEGLTNREIREWSHHGRAQTTRILRGLVAKGRIVASGKRGRGSRYWLPQHAPGEPNST